jgi:uncharacterized membrane protein YphA (DoxX/SURF4 family)
MQTTTTEVEMNVALWVVQALMAAVFLMAGGMKATADLTTLAESMAWVQTAPGWFVRFVGISEVLGAVGLILPAALRIAPKLTPLAAASLAFVMLSAIVMHVGIEGDVSSLPVNLVFLGLLSFVAWGRTVKAPIAPRGAATSPAAA